MTVGFSRAAQNDLAEITAYIASDNPDRAVSFVNELEKRCISLTDNPERFPIVRRRRAWSLRKLSHGDWLIFYTVRKDRVEIQRIVHGSRDWMTLLYMPF